MEISIFKKDRKTYTRYIYFEKERDWINGIL